MNIVVVEDDSLFAEMLREFLQDKFPRHFTIIHHDGESLVKRNLSSIDVFIFDFNLSRKNPDAMNGVDILRFVQERYPGKPVIFLSGQEDPEVAAAAVRHGALAYIVKNDKAFIKLESTLNELIKPAPEVINENFAEQYSEKKYEEPERSSGMSTITILILAALILGGIAYVVYWFKNN